MRPKTPYRIAGCSAMQRTVYCMHNRSLFRRAVSVRPSVRLSVCPGVCPVTFMYCIEKSNHTLKHFQHRVSTPFWFFDTKAYGNIPTVIP